LVDPRAACAGTVQFPALPVDLVPAGVATVRSTFLLSSTALTGFDAARNGLVQALREPPGPGNDLRTSSSSP
jgi:hypothetical protein